MKNFELTKNENDACVKLLCSLGFISDDENIKHHLDQDIISLADVDGIHYAWYLDERYNVAVNVETLEIIDSEETLQHIFKY